LNVEGVQVPLGGIGYHLPKHRPPQAPSDYPPDALRYPTDPSPDPPFATPLPIAATYVLDDPNRDRIYAYCLRFDIVSPHPPPSSRSISLAR
jgi:hypothetical protein